jgi:hypothetical protein
MDGVESVTAQGLGLGVEYKYINGSDVFQGYSASANLAAIVKNKVVRACALNGFVHARCAIPDEACMGHFGDGRWWSNIEEGVPLVASPRAPVLRR